MKGFTQIASIFALALIVLALPSIGSAQRRDRDRDDDYYGRNNDDNYRNGGNNNSRNIRGTIESLRNRARNFERRMDQIDNRNDNVRYKRNNNRYGNLEELSDRFSRATANLADEYGRGRNMDNSRDEARRVLDIGSQIENALRNSGANRHATGEWGQISRDLRIIANAYNLNYSNSGGNGDWRNRVPFPLPF